jgi:ribonuclease HI
MEYINIYTDGSCSQGAFNNWPGGYAVVVVPSNRKEILLTGRSDSTTNNEMELTAFLTALNFAQFQTNILEYDYINIHTDSAYIYNCFKDGWYNKWEMNGWLTATKDPVKNKELWIQILKLKRDLEQKLQINIKKVKAHSDDKYNDMADQLAVRAKEGQLV